MNPLTILKLVEFPYNTLLAGVVGGNVVGVQITAEPGKPLTAYIRIADQDRGRLKRFVRSLDGNWREKPFSEDE